MILFSFASSNEEVKSAASYALGKIHCCVLNCVLKLSPEHSTENFHWRLYITLNLF